MRYPQNTKQCKFRSALERAQRLTAPLSRFRRSNQAFSLIEVTLALGIVAFALLPLVALLPVGLDSQRDAIESTTNAQILQTITGDLQRTEFDQLVNSEQLTTQTIPVRHFDDLGNEIEDIDAAPFVGTGARAYDVFVNLEYPAQIGVADNYAIVRAEIRLARNPGGLAPEVIFDPSKPEQYSTSFALIAKTSK